MPTPPIEAQPTPGKGSVTPPNTNVIITTGGTATAGSGGLIHLLGAHPAITALVVFAGVVAIIAVISILQSKSQTKQDAPVPGIVPVPVK